MKSNTKKIVSIMLLSLASMTTAEEMITSQGEGRYNMLADYSPSGDVTGIYVLNTVEGTVKYCLITSSGKDTKVGCTEWVTNDF